MPNDNKQALENKSDKKVNEKEQSEDPAVQRGKAAIDAQQVSNPEPEDVKKEKEEKDAEQWRNEG
jgi:hypothetical protein